MKKSILLVLVAFIVSGMAVAQHKTSMNVKDLNSTSEKYIKKNHEGYKTVEAFKYDIIYEVVIYKADTMRNLVFDATGKFLYKEDETEKAKMPLQTRTTIALKDVQEPITKYVTKNYKGYKLTEAFEYDVVYSAKIKKGEMSETLFFDKDGTFITMGMNAPTAPIAKHDTSHQ